MSSAFLCICLNPVIQKTIILPQLNENEVNRSHEYYTDASGKGVNASRVLTQLGEQVVHLTQLGGRFRDYFLSMAEDDRLNIEWVESFSEIRGCYTLISQAERTSTEIVEEAQPVEKGTEARIMQLFKKRLPDFDTIIISGTKAAGFSETIFPAMVQMAKQQGKTVILDYRGPDLLNSVAFHPDIIKPNYREFVVTFFPEYASDAGDQLPDRVREKMVQLYTDYKIITILTRGSQEILYMDAGNVKSIAPPKITPLNTIGCGDAFTAGFAAAWHRKMALDRAIRQGVDCARENALQIRPGVIRK